MISIKADGANRVGNKYRRVIASHRSIFDPVVENHVKGVRKVLSRKPYPPKLMNQKYVRTGRLGVSYSTKKISPSVYTIRNSRKGAWYVVDERGQADIHKGRWYTIQQVEREQRKSFTKSLTKEVKDFVS